MDAQRPKSFKTQWLYTVDQGRRLELVALDEKDQVDENVEYPLLTILADEKTEELLMELYTAKGIVHVPLTDLMTAMELAKEDVHSEAWFEANVRNRNENT